MTNWKENIKYDELRKMKEFEIKRNVHTGKEYLLHYFNVDEYMGFSVCRIKAYKKENGMAEIKYTDEFVFDGNEKEKETTCTRYIGFMDNRLKRLLNIE